MQRSEINQRNKLKFEELVRQIDRSGAEIEKLLDFLNRGDFFKAPATATSFRNYEGGLCEQAISRYYTMKKIVENSSYLNISNTSILITSLFADLGKIDYYEATFRNKKEYSSTGTRSDDLGRFDWVTERGWGIKDHSQRFIFGTLGQNADRIITDFIPLTLEESAAIVNLHADFENSNFNLTPIYTKYPLAVFLNAADKIASFVDSREDAVPF